MQVRLALIPCCKLLTIKDNFLKFICRNYQNIYLLTLQFFKAEKRRTFELLS